MTTAPGRTAGIVQARMSSRRLPGKVLLEVEGRPLLQHTIERLQRCTALDDLAIATSVDRSDDPIAGLCERLGVRCFRGPLDDVAERFRRAAEALNADAFVRISGDSPLIDPEIVRQGIECLRSSSADLASNVVVRSFPVGQSVEVVRRESFGRALAMMTTTGHREHVTSVFYERAGEFRIASFSAPAPWQHVRLAVDTREDLEVVARVIAALGRPPREADVASLVRVYREVIETWSSCGSGSSVSASASSI